ncbi:hypothetical protein AC244_13630 [Ensifer adhaerens]|uniref:Uncharacterized protein n=1 Tax=Ensifer adhaerens TaxID=106592 RepID=A0A0L8BV81_ENSAD|nr:hypothetical protein AC244_13630 [Ensifer adhaerens]
MSTNIDSIDSFFSYVDTDDIVATVCLLSRRRAEPQYWGLQPLAPMSLIPRQLIVREPPTRVMYLHFVRQAGPPVPKHQVSIPFFGARCKTVHQDTRRTPRPQSIVYRPGWGSPSFGKRSGPTAGHFLHRDAIRGPTNFRSKIRDVIAVDIVGTKYTGVDTMGKTLIGFLNRGHDTEGEIESRHAFWVESCAPYGRAIS